MNLKHGIPENIRRCMAPETRKEMKAPTNPESKTLADRRSERQLQDDMEALCRQRDLFYRRMPMHRKSPWPGFPDFLIALPELDSAIGAGLLLVEAKVANGNVDSDQIQVHQDFKDKTGAPVHVVWSLAQFKELLDLHQP